MDKEVRNSRWDIMSDETGKEALRMSKTFNEKVMLIRSHLVKEDHPINKIVKEFDQQFCLSYKFKIEKLTSNLE